MIKRVVIEYHVLENAVKVSDNDFTTFELFGMLEAVKQMAAHDWLKDEDDIWQEG